MVEFVDAKRGSSFPLFHHIWKDILIFAALVVVTAFLLYPLQKLMNRRMEVLRDALLGGVELLIGREIEYASIGPSIFSTLDIRNIRIRRSDASIVLSISRLRLSYSFWELCRGNIADSLRSIRIDRPLLNFNLTQDEDLQSLFPASGGRTPEELIHLITLALPENVRISIRNGTGDWDAGGFHLQADSVGFDAAVRNGRINFQGKWNLGFSLSPLKGISGAWMSGRIAGECSADLSNGSANLTIPSLQEDRFKLRPLTVRLALSENSLEIRKISDRLPVDISLDYDLYSRKIAGNFRCDNFLLQDLVSLKGPWQPYDYWLATRVSGQALLENRGGELSYRLDISGKRDARTAGGASFVIKGQGDQRQIDFSQLSLDLSQGKFSFQGGIGFQPFTPNGYLSISNLSLTGNESFSAGLNILSREQEISIFGENISAGPVVFAALDMAVNLEPRGLSVQVSALRFQNTESYEAIRLSRLSLDCSLDYDPRNIQATFSLEAFSLQDLIELSRPFTALPLSSPAMAVAGGISLTTEVFITTDFEHILYNAPRIVMAYDGTGPNLAALVSLSGTDRRFELSNGRLTWSNGGVELAGYADFSNSDDITFSLTTSYLGFFYEVEGMILDWRSVSIRGSYGLQVFITSTGFDTYSGYAAAQEILLPYPGGEGRLSFDTSLNYEWGPYWSVDINRFELSGLVTPGSPLAALRFSGIANQDGLVLEDIYFDDGWGILRGGLTLKKVSDSGFEGILNLDNTTRMEHYGFQASYRTNSPDGAGGLTLHFTGTNMQLGRALRNSFNSLASGELSLVWDSPDQFSAELRLDSLEAKVEEKNLYLSAGVSLNSKELVLRDLGIVYAGLQAALPQLYLDYASGQAETGARIWGTLAGRELEAEFTVEAQFQPVNSLFRLSRILDSINGSLNVSDISYDTLQADEPFSFFFSRAGSLISLSGGPRNMVRFKIFEGGDFYAGLSAPSPVRGSIIGTLDSRTIDAQTQDLYVDFAPLWNLLPPRAKEDFIVAGGYATASLQISGPLGDPEFFGTIQGNSLRFQVPAYLGADIRPIPLTITLEGNEAFFGPIPAQVGAGLGTASGWCRFERWIPDNFTINVAVPLETPIPVGFDINGVIAHGYTSGNLFLSLADMILSVSGDLTAHETEISLNTDELLGSSNLYNPQSSIAKIIDLKVRTGRKVEFLWPATRIPIVHAYADQGSSLQITSDTLTGRFSMEGDVILRGGEIFYVERSFYLREGSLSFKETEAQFDPRITARAEVRDRTNTGPVTISMIVDNAPLRSFTARFESVPALSQMEIFSLLGQSLTGTSSREEEGRTTTSFVASSIDLLTQFAVIRRFERQVRDFLWLDMFSVRTQVLQNALLRAAGLQDPVDRIDGVGNYFDNTTVFLGKYFGMDMFTQFMLSLRYDAQKPSFGGLRLEPDIGIELHSPLFDIRWNFVPLHPENMYISDQSFTLTWRWSF